MARRFERSADTRILAARLAQLEVGDAVSCEQLTREMGRPIDSTDQKLTSARRIILREEGKVLAFDGHRNLVCLSDTEVVDGHESYRRRIHNAAKKSCELLSTVAVENLPQAKQKEFYAAMSFGGMLKHVTTVKSAKRLSAAVDSNGSHELPLAKTLEAFK